MARAYPFGRELGGDLRQALPLRLQGLQAGIGRVRIGGGGRRGGPAAAGRSLRFRSGYRRSYRASCEDCHDAWGVLR